MSENKVYRIIDANLNRYKEGIRVVEDFARYYFNDPSLSGKLKELRHIARVDNSREFIKFRDSINDVLKENTDSEMTRTSFTDVIFANLKRAQESARVLEECFKIVDLDFSVKFKLARYSLYGVEKIFNQIL